MAGGFHWRAWIKWIAIAVGILVAVAAAAGYLVLSSARFQRWVARKAEVAASQALGTPVHISNLRLQSFTLSPSADVLRFSIRGRGPASAPPLLTVDHAHVVVRITSLLHRSWQLTSVELDHPVVHLLVNPDGTTNLPQPPAGNGPGPDIFQLGIRNLAVRNGEVFVNDRPAELEAELRSLTLDVAFHPLTRRYTGNLAYAQGSVTWDHHQALPHSLQMAFDAGRDGVKIPSLTLTSGVVHLAASATVPTLAPLRLDARYQMQVGLAALRPIVGQHDLPRGTVTVDGAAAWHDDQFTASGRFSSPALVTTSSALSIPVGDLAGRYQFAGRDLKVTGLRATVLGGALGGDAQVRAVGSKNLGNFNLQVHGAQVARIARLAPQGARTLGELGIAGTAQITAAGQWQGRFDTLVVHAQAGISAQIQSAKYPRQPVEASLDAVYDAARQRLTLTDTHLQAAGLSFTANGALTHSGSGNIALEATASDLHQAELLTDRLATALGRPLPPLELSGQAGFRGTVSGRLKAPSIQGHLQGGPLAVRGVHWRSLKADLAASPTQVQVRNLVVVAGTQGRITLDATLGLSHWQPSGASPMTVRVAAVHFALDQVAPLVPGPMPLSGILSAHAQVQGTLSAPQGEGVVAVAQAHLHLGGKDELGAGLQSFSIQAHGAGDTVTLDAAAQLDSGPVSAHGSVNYQTRAYQAEIHADKLLLDRLPALTRRRLPITGTIALHGSGQGTFASPNFQIAATAPQLDIAGQILSGLELDAQIHGRQLHATFAGTALKAALKAQADLGLGGSWPIQARFDAPAVPLAPLLVAFAPQQAEGIHGQTEVHASLSGPLADPQRLQAQITLPALSLAYGPVLRLQAAQPIVARLAQGVVTLEPTHITGTDTDLRLSGSIPARADVSAAALQMAINGQVDARLLEAFVPDLTSTGQVQINITAAGTFAQPRLSGTLQITALAINNPDWPVTLQGGHGALRLANDRIDVTAFEASVGGGTLTLSGGINLGTQTHFNLALAARQVRFRLPASLRDTVNADLVFTGTPESALISGRAQVLQVAPVPGFDFATLATDLSTQAVTLAAPDSFLRNLRLEVAISTPNQIAVTSRDFSLRANANLNLRGTGDDPVILGRVDVTSGDLIFRGNRYVLQAGTLDFINPTRTIANVNITADTTINQYNLHLRLQGPADNLRTTYNSDPALPPADIINLLAFGQTTESGSANPLPGNLGAETLVAGAVTSQITDRVEKIAGISHLSVDPVLGANQQGNGARITLQQRVTGNLYVTISTDVTSTQRDVIEIQYHFTPRVSITGVRKQNGGLGANLQFKKTWH